MFSPKSPSRPEDESGDGVRITDSVERKSPFLRKRSAPIIAITVQIGKRVRRADVFHLELRAQGNVYGETPRRSRRLTGNEIIRRRFPEELACESVVSRWKLRSRIDYIAHYADYNTVTRNIAR